MAIENSVIFLPCRDIAATHDFYTRVVGLQKVQGQAGGTLHIYDTGYGYWGFCQYPGRPPGAGRAAGGVPVAQLCRRGRCGPLLRPG